MATSGVPIGYGDAYADHPSFGTGIISRALERYGYKVAILSQLSWKDAEDFRRLGRPRLGCLINGGNVAATVNHFSAGKRRLYGDKYSPEVQPEKDRTGG